MFVDAELARHLELQRAHGACDFVVHGGIPAPHGTATEAGLVLHSPDGRLRWVGGGWVESARVDAGSVDEVTLCPLARPSFARAVLADGYRLIEFENVWVRPASEPLADSECNAVEVEAIGALSGVADWSNVVRASLSMAEATGAEAERNVFGAAGVSLVRASVAGEAAGGGGLLVRGNVATLFGGAVLERCRRRGVQTALLLRRFELAREQGAAWVVGITEPGHVSERNLVRLGFYLAYTALLCRKEERQRTQGE
jgi:hypothetical protein